VELGMDFQTDNRFIPDCRPGRLRAGRHELTVASVHPRWAVFLARSARRDRYATYSGNKSSATSRRAVQTQISRYIGGTLVSKAAPVNARASSP
jgi:hypothetical protein